jgi:hypothetical protein
LGLVWTCAPRTTSFAAATSALWEGANSVAINIAAAGITIALSSLRISLSQENRRGSQAKGSDGFSILQGFDLTITFPLQAGQFLGA